MILPIATYGVECLRKKAAQAASATPEIKTLARDMLETMYHAEGVGLAAPQVGRDVALCVIDVPTQSEKPDCREANAGIEMPLVMLNPEIVPGPGTQRNNEGCLSFPEIHAMVTRANEVSAAYTTLGNERKTLTARGLLARAIQHEMDHLNGVLLVDRMSALQKIAVGGQLKKLAKGSGKC